MTLLSYVGGTPGFELFVCGAPSREWLEWVRTTAVPLTASQVQWRLVAQARVDALGLGVEPRPPVAAPMPEPAAEPEPERRRGRPSRNPYGRPPRDKSCPHTYMCDQCGQCERCNCYDCPL